MQKSNIGIKTSFENSRQFYSKLCEKCFNTNQNAKARPDDILLKHHSTITYEEKSIKALFCKKI